MVVWGGAFIAVKVAIRHISPYQFILARFIPSLILLIPIILWQYRNNLAFLNLWKTLSRAERWKLILAGFLVVPGYHISINYGATLIPAGWTGLVIASNPACIAILAALTLGEKIPLRRWIGIGVALAGLVFIIANQSVIGSGGDELTIGQKALGVVITFGGVISWGGFTVLSKKLVQNSAPLVLLLWVLAIGTAIALPGIDPQLPQKMIDAPQELWWAVLFVSAGSTVFGFTVWFRVLQLWQASRAGVFIYFGPMVALFGGWWLLDEPMGIATIIGAATVICGVVIATIPLKNKNKTA